MVFFQFEVFVQFDFSPFVFDFYLRASADIHLLDGRQFRLA